MQSRTLFLFALLFLFSCNQPIPKDVLKAGPDPMLAQKLNDYKTVSEFHRELTHAMLQLSYWVQTPGASEEKAALETFVNKTYSERKTALRNSAAGWSAQQKESMNQLLLASDQLILYFKENMEQLGSFDDYNDPMKMLPVESNVFDNDGDLRLTFKRVDEELSAIESGLFATIGGGAH